MRKLGLLVLIILFAVTANAQYLNNMRSDEVFAKQYGKDYIGFTNALAKIEGLQKTLVVDGGGEWLITNSVTIPTNVNLFVAKDTKINISVSEVFEVDGFISSGDWQIFSGAGVVTGPCANPFVFDQWVPTNQLKLEYLGTPFSQLSTNSYESWTNYIGQQDEVYFGLMTNWVKLYVTNDGLAQTAFITNWVVSNFMSPASITNFVTNYVNDALTNYLSVSNGTIIPSNFPAYILQSQRGTGIASQVFGTNGTYWAMTNTTDTVDSLVPNGFVAWAEDTGVIVFKRKGAYKLHMQAGNRMPSAITGIQYYLMKNGVGAGNLEAIIDLTESSAFSGNQTWQAVGQAYVNVPTDGLTDYYRIAARFTTALPTSTARVTNSFFNVRWEFQGDYTLVD